MTTTEQRIADLLPDPHTIAQSIRDQIAALDPSPDQPFTAARVRDFIAGQRESELPDQVLAALRPYHGKNITTRLLAKLPALPDGDTWRLLRHYGWTTLENFNYRRTGGKYGLSILLARSETSVPLDVDWVERENRAYYGARRERNVKRDVVGNNPAFCQLAADVLNQYAAALEALRIARVRFEELVANVFAPDMYALEKWVDPHRKAHHTEPQ